MPAKFFSITKKANKETSKLPLHVQNKIEKAFSLIMKNPVSGQRLHGELSGYYKYRVGDYRIVYVFNKKESRIDVLKIEHRQGVYK